MNADPITRLPMAFGNVLERLRRERGWDAEALANAANLSPREVQGMEGGTHIPTLLGFFRLAIALGESPVILLAEVVSAWRADPSDHGLYKSRPSDLARLYRLGYFHDPGDFRELPQVYESQDHATADARKLKVLRGNLKVAPPDAVTIYVRVGYVGVDPRPEAEESPS